MDIELPKRGGLQNNIIKYDSVHYPTIYFSVVISMVLFNLINEFISDCHRVSFLLFFSLCKSTL